jgi:hypothetical protein
MTTSLAVGRSKLGCGFPPSPASASRMFIILAGVEGEPSQGPALHVGWWPASSSSIRRRRVFTSLVEEANLGYVGPASYRLSAVACPALWAGWLRRRLRRCLLPLWPGRGYPSTARVMVTPCTGPTHPPLLLHAGHIGGSYKTSYAAVVAATFLDGLVLTPVGQTGARTPSCMLRQPPPSGAEVVAVAGEATPCRGGCLRWRGHQSHLPLSP